MFIDRATLVVRGGNGGNGCVSFRREKFVRFGGPDGGSGGHGADVFLRVSHHLNTLLPFARHQQFRGEDAGHGASKRMQGKSAAPLYVDVPPGTIVRDASTAELIGDLTRVGQTLLVAQGGRGGRGNEVFKTSTRQTPKFAERGEPGHSRRLALELKLIADVGLLGKPNAGKSTLLASISAARPKIADYPFTTLSPNLGVVELDGRTFVVADLPGLIEGAHEGAGLGLEFLRHVERTRLLVHLLDGLSADPLGDYEVINRELREYSAVLADKPQVVALNKLDVPDAQARYATLRAVLPEQAGSLYPISAATGQGVRELLRAVAARLAELPAEEPPKELYVFRPGQRAPKAYRISKVSKGLFRVAGEEIERLALMTDWTSEEGIERFQRILYARGVTSKLEEEGVQFGDTVMFGEIELEWT